MSTLSFHRPTMQHQSSVTQSEHYYRCGACVYNVYLATNTSFCISVYRQSSSFQSEYYVCYQTAILDTLFCLPIVSIYTKSLPIMTRQLNHTDRVDSVVILLQSRAGLLSAAPYNTTYTTKLILSTRSRRVKIEQHKQSERIHTQHDVNTSFEHKYKSRLVSIITESIAGQYAIRMARSVYGASG